MQCPCGTRVRVRIWAAIQGQAPAPTVRCTGCGNRWTAQALLDFAACQCVPPWAPCDPPDVWLDSEAVSIATGVSRATLYRWARSQHIRSDHGRFHLADVITRRENQA